MKQPEYQLSWTCHVCGQERPDERISVRKRPLVIDGKVVPYAHQNIRYCNDRPACIQGSERQSHFQELL